MQVVVDGKTGLSTPDGGASLGSVFSSLRLSASARNRVVTSLELDGEVLTSEREADLAGRTTAGFGLLEVTTVDPVPFSIETLAGMLVHIANVERAHAAAEALIAEVNHVKAFDKLDECFRGWDILNRAVRDVGALNSADLRVLQAGGESLDARLQTLQGALHHFRNALSLKEIIKAGDVAREELKPLLAPWRRVIETLSQNLAKPPGSGK
jgi:hypothetical protein